MGLLRIYEKNPGVWVYEFNGLSAFGGSPIEAEINYFALEKKIKEEKLRTNFKIKIEQKKET